MDWQANIFESQNGSGERRGTMNNTSSKYEDDFDKDPSNATPEEHAAATKIAVGVQQQQQSNSSNNLTAATI